jgi:hypothetical protein
MGQRMRTTLQAIKTQLRKRLHEPVNAVGQWLKHVVEGYYRYHAVPENLRALRRFRERLRHLRRSMLGRRSQNDGYRVPVSCIPILTFVLTPFIQGRSRVR